MNNVLNILNEAYKKQITLIGVLADPDSYNLESFNELINNVNEFADLLLIGGSHCVIDKMNEFVNHAKERCEKPVVLFPGPANQLCTKADAILYLSLISGRNPELLIGWHVQNAYQLKESGIEVIPTGYVLVDGGIPTSVSYVSNTVPIPAGKNGIITSTAIAGELLGLKTIYLEAGSGAINPISPQTIKIVSSKLSIPLIVGGGIKNAKDAKAASEAGATMIVVGNAIEKNVELLKQIKNSF